MIDTGIDFIWLGILGGIFLGVLAFLIAVIVIIRNIRRNRRMPVEHLIVTVEAIHSGPMDKGYHIRFRTKNKRITLDVGKKKYFGFSEGDRGELVYQGYKFISFEKTSKKIAITEPDFIREEKNGPTALFYGQVGVAGVNVSSDKRLTVDLDDMRRLVNTLDEANDDWFFVLKKPDGKTLQVERDSKNVKITIGSDQDDDVRSSDLKDLHTQIKAFFENHTSRRQT